MVPRPPTQKITPAAESRGRDQARGEAIGVDWGWAEAEVELFIFG